MRLFQWLILFIFFHPFRLQGFQLTFIARPSQHFLNDFAFFSYCINILAPTNLVYKWILFLLLCIEENLLQEIKWGLKTNKWRNGEQWYRKQTCSYDWGIPMTDVLSKSCRSRMFAVLSQEHSTSVDST